MSGFNSVTFRSAILAALVFCVVPGVAIAQDQKVLVTVNDLPITSFDVTQRINLWKLLGRSTEGDGLRKRALNSLIDDIAKIQEADKAKAGATEKELSARLEGVAKGLKTDSNGLKGKLKEQGISIAAMKQYLAAQIAFSRLIRGKYKISVEATPAEIDSKLSGYRAEIDGKVRAVMNDPRNQPITVYQLLQVDFPIDSAAGGVPEELMQSRAIEVSQFVKKFNGCKSARAAASGIFNVKIGKIIEADGRKLPAPMKAAFNKVKAGRAIGPMRGPSGLQALGFCGVRKISPQKPKVSYPTRDQAATAVVNEKYAEAEAKYSGEWRKGLMIEYRDPAYAQ